jgi:cysteine desulfuration protein SufE
MKREIKRITEEFEMFDDWEDRYAYIIDLGKKMPCLDESHKISANKVDGCVSQVWLVSEKKDGKYYFSADSDAFIVRGLLAIIIRVFSGATEEDILAMDFQELFDNLGLNNHLSPSRSNGLFAVVQRIKATPSS